jgi:hypothetical protein
MMTVVNKVRPIATARINANVTVRCIWSKLHHDIPPSCHSELGLCPSCLVRQAYGYHYL